MMLILIGESELLENLQVSDRVSVSFDCLVSGVQIRLLLKFLIGLTGYESVYLMHVGLILISLPRFFTDGLIYILILEVGHIGVSLVTIGCSFRKDGWNLRVG